MKYMFWAVALLMFVSCGSNIKVSTKNEVKEVQLPDGSVALLNEHSSISYSEQFAERIVSQVGEVFYDVEKGKETFTVVTELGEVKALGTSFNVKEDGEELDVQVESGKVEMIIGKVSETIIKGQRAVFKGLGKAIEVGKANFDYKQWQRDFNQALKKAQKELKKGSKQIEKESKKISKEFKKELKNLQDKIEE